MSWDWVPITPKTLEDEARQCAESKPAVTEAEEEMPIIRSEPFQMMSVYAVTNGPEGVIQASTPICQAMGTSITGPRATIQSSSEWSGIPDSSLGMEELNIMQALHRQLKAKVDQARQVVKNAPIATSDIPRDIP